jgi:hypothetical protein
MVDLEGCGSKWSWPVLVLSQHVMSKEYNKNSQENWPLSQGFNLRLLKYKAGLLSTTVCSKMYLYC